MTTTHTVIDSPIGHLTLVSDGTALTGVYMESHRHAKPDAWGSETALGQAPPVLQEAAGQLRAYFAGERTDFDLPLRPLGTPFHVAVWEALRSIPYGQTISYAELARRVGSPGASRAVGLANGRNPISVVVPCHRVIGTDGSLTGYGGGVERKRRLLDLERSSAGATLW
jgi:methylated-DNA-[protein]-cysteine S-methyltransferase